MPALVPGGKERRLSPSLLALAAVAVLGAACGYRAVTAYRARGGAERVHVHPFENDSSDPALGALITAALRDELARRGAAAGAGASARLEGSVRVTSGTPSSWFGTGTAVTVEIYARLTVDGKQIHEHTFHRTEAHPVGADALEAEGRKAAAIQKLARDAARELLAEFEAR